MEIGLSLPTMKLTRLISATVVLGLSAGLVISATAAEPLPIDQNEVLQIVIRDNVMVKRQDSWTAPRLETERFNVMRDAIKRSAKKLDYNGPINIQRFAGGIKDANQRLTLYVYRWEQGLESIGRSMTVEFHMDATLSIGNEEWDMGTFSARNSHYAVSGPSSEDYRPSAERAIEQMVELYRAAIAEAATSEK